MRKIYNKSILVLMLVLIELFSFNVHSQNTCAAPQIIASLPYSLASGTTCGTLNDYNTNLSLGGSSLYTTGEDRIFRFTPATSGNVTISVTQPNNGYLGMYLYTGCPFTAYVGGVQNNTNTKSFTVAVTAGVNYFLRLDTWSSPFCTGFTNLTISAPVAPPPPPSNDACANATPLPCGTTGLAGTTVNSVSETVPAGAGSNFGVWYTFTGDGQNTTITSTTTFDHRLTIFTGACGTNTILVSQDGSSGTETVTFATTNGLQYRVYVSHYSAGSTTTGTFNISRTCAPAPTPPANNECASATTLTPGATGATCSNTAGTSVNATQSLFACAGTADDDVWYQFTATSNSHTVTVTPSTMSDVVFQVLSGACNGTSVVCIDATSGISAETTTLTGLTIGTVYRIRVYSWANGSGQGTFNICVTTPAAPPPPPSNDACANATPLPCGTSGLAGTTVNSVAEIAPSACVGTNGVWYSFVGDGQVSTITVFSALDLGLYIGSGSCAGLTPIRCEDYFFGGTNETTSIITTSGVTYYVYVANYTGSTTGTFTISRTCNAPLSNDNCANAQSVSIQCPATATSVSGTTLNASEEPSLADPTCDDDGLIRDVWYTFNSGSNTSVNLTVTLGTASWLGGEVYTTCGSLATGLTIGGNAGNCDFNLSAPNPTVISGLTTNTTYRLRLYTNETYDTPGTFSFTLTNSVNNPGAVSVPASICAGTATSITNVTAATGAPGTVNYYFYYRGGPSNVGWQMYEGPTTNTSSSLPAAVINTPGTWFIARNSDFGCGEANNATTSDLQLIVNSLPTVTANASSTAPCVGQNVTLTGGGATSYLWNNGVSNGVSFTPASTTTYTVIGTTGSCSGTAQVTVTLPTQGAALGNNGENATCTVNQAGWVHFYHSSGRLLASINSQGQNLGNVTVTSYVDGANAIVPACDLPSVETAVLQRHWVITPQSQPASNVLVRLPFGDAEVSSLAIAASTTSNTQDNSNGIPNLKLSRYHGPSNVNASAMDNCSANGGNGNTEIHIGSANGTTNGYSNVLGQHYNEYSIPEFSEFWLHWQSDISPLPVVLSAAHVECLPASNQVVLEWTTSSELNSDKFLVQRSRDGELWETIGQEQGAGNSSSLTEYTFTDVSAFGGQSYYQIVQYDFDGTATIYGPWTTECSEKNGITVYPNPTAGKFVISIMSEEDQKDAILEIMDLSGKIISSEEVQIESGATEIYRDLSDLNAGTYLVVIRTTKSVFSPVRVVKGQ